MKRSVKYGGSFVPQHSPHTEELNTQLTTTGEVLTSDTSLPTGIKFTPSPVCDVIYATVTAAELTAAYTSTPTDKNIIDITTGSVYVAVSGQPGNWTTTGAPEADTLITKNMHYYNPNTNTLFFAEDDGRLVRICNLGPEIATLAQTAAGTATDVAVTADTAKAAWQQWRTA